MISHRSLTPAQCSNFWTLTARGYSAWRARSITLLSGQPFGLEREARLFLAACNPRAGERWLDAGTSAGFYSRLLGGVGAQVMAADLSPAMLRAARRELAGVSGVEWALLNVEDSGLPDASFDGVVVGATLNETANPELLLRECARLLRPGGRLWLMYIARSGGSGQRWLSRLGGLTFPDPAWVSLQLAPTLVRTRTFQVGEVTFEQHETACHTGMDLR